MRSREFLSEAGLKLSDFDTKNNHYWQNLLTLIITNAPIELTDGSQSAPMYPSTAHKELSKIWDGSTLATPQQINALKNYKLELADGRSVPLGKIQKSEKIKSTGGAESVAKFWNLGNVVEGVMGAAVSAKFAYPEKEIQSADIVKILKLLKAGKSPAPQTGKSKSVPLIPYTMSMSARNDNLVFQMSLNVTDFKALELSYKNPRELETYPGYEEIFKAYEDAANYVNTADTVKTAVDRVVNDKRSNQIIVESEGANAEKQTSTKADLFITIDNVRERLLSLKSKAVPQIGQVSGHAFDNVEQFFKSTLGFGLPAQFAKYFPKGTFKEVGTTIFEKALPVAYKHMFNSLSKTLGGDETYSEYNFVKQIYDGIHHHATLGEDVIIVYLSPSAKKAYTELKIGPELFEALQDFELVPYLSGPTTIKVVGRPVTDIAKELTGGKEQEFVQLRSYMQKASGIRNIVEVKSLLKTLADIDNIKKRKEALTVGQKLPATPTAKPVAPTVPKVGPNTTTLSQNSMQTPGIVNRNRTLGNKIPMGTPPAPGMPQ